MYVYVNMYVYRYMYLYIYVCMYSSKQVDFFTQYVRNTCMLSCKKNPNSFN